MSPPIELYEVERLEPFDLVVGLTEAQARALAELCKRIGFADCRALAVDEAEAYQMIGATDRVRRGLEAVGVRVR